MIRNLSRLFRKVKGGNFGIVPKSETDYPAINAIQALSYCDVKGKDVLVVGCNTGNDCSYFVTAGAGHVQGLDVLQETGRDFKHEKVSYTIGSAEDMAEFQDGTFDFVYCFATMEHVPNIEAAFREMKRVCKPGGFVYTVAAPLWHSAFGHHKKEYFEEYPWIHLCLSKDEMKDWFNARQAHKYPAGFDITPHIEYMMDKANMNQRRAAEYLNICNKLGMKIVLNLLERDPTCPLAGETRERLLPVYGEDELLTMTHRFVAIK
jgi:ubiquinone/menaquinone biosynthesis C-methylase UbiE